MPTPLTTTGAVKAPPPMPPMMPPLADDPLIVDMTVAGQALTSSRFTATLALARVKYYDGSGTRWEIVARRPDARATAEKLFAKVLAQWSAPSVRPYASESLEEQLLGLALVFLDGAAMDVAIDARGDSPRIRNIGELCDASLPERFPFVLRYRVNAFLAEACGRIVAPVPTVLRINAAYEARGLTYRIKQLLRGTNSIVATADGYDYDRAAGVQRKDSTTFDTRTGLVCKSVAMKIKESLSGDIQRFARERWQVRASAYVPAAAPAQAAE